MCMCVCVCVCVCVGGFIVACSPPPSVYLALRANDQGRRFINIHLHLHYITYDLVLTDGMHSIWMSAGDWSCLEGV